MAAGDIEETLKRELLSARALNYRRNTIAIGAVLVAIFWLPELELKNLSLFGLKPPNEATAKELVFTVLWGLMIYNAGFFAFYAQRDLRTWYAQTNWTSTNGPVRAGFPELKMYLWMRPRDP